MKNKLMLLEDKMWLKGWGVIESVIDLLKHICDIEQLKAQKPGKYNGQHNGRPGGLFVS